MKNKKNFFFLMMLVCFLVASVVLFFSLGKLSRHALWDQEGAASEGKIFGIQIGDNVESAIRNMNDLGLSVEGPNRDNRCLSMRLEGDLFLQGYDHSWRGGVICVSIKDRNVSGVAWSFNSIGL